MDVDPEAALPNPNSDSKTTTSKDDDLSQYNLDDYDDDTPGDSKHSYIS